MSAPRAVLTLSESLSEPLSERRRGHYREPEEGKQEMVAKGSRPPVQPGEMAPDFVVPAVHREGSVSLADYLGRSSLMLALYRGLY